ncbi:MAG: hydantoinase/oxoprolinase family protein, partial [Candidatus Acidiferrum sp.]
MIASVLGLDIGGANLKAFHTAGTAKIVSFPLWRNPAGLADALDTIIESLPAAAIFAVTMTGELCDCFASKREGVNAILDAVIAVAAGVPVRVWRTEGGFAEPELARSAPLSIAAANWHALATFVGRLAARGPALSLDIGSTTTDIIPLLDGSPVAHGRTDPERLKYHELVYTGAQRTPICALLG